MEGGDRKSLGGHKKKTCHWYARVGGKDEGLQLRGKRGSWR